MSIYTDPELIVDETAVTEGALAALADRLGFALGLAEDEEWEPQEGSPETSLAEAFGILLATAMATINEQERNDYAGFGELILQTPRIVAQPATATSRWTFDTGGTHLVPDGSELVLDAADGTPVGFATVGDVTFDGTTVDVDVVALETGLITSGLTGVARDFEPLPHLSTVELIDVSSGGADDESRDDYLERVARRARRMKIVPIVTDDYADAALDHPSVGSAVAVRLLDLTAPTDPPDAAGHVTVFTRDADGNDNSPEVGSEVVALMMGEDRPLSVTVHHGDPTRTPVTIAVSVRLATGADEDATVLAIQSAVAAAYDPATYGIDEDAPGRWRAPRDADERTINRYDVTAIIDDLTGVAKIEDVTVNGAASVALDGWAPLPELTGPVAVTVLA